MVAVITLHDLTAKEEVSKKKIKEHIQADSKHAATRGMAMQLQRMVSQVLSSCHIQCCFCHAAHGIAGTVIGQHGVVVAVAMLCVVSWLLLSHHVVL